ncbi:MAG: CocE/NonD family hydrolase [Myxococcota bacterium]
MKRMTIAAGILVLIAAVLLGTAYGFRYEVFQRSLELPHYSHAGGPSRTEWVAMRDGTRLQTQIFLPEGTPPFPTVLIRNPYNFANAFAFICGVFTRYGFACVHQDVRGRMGSAGKWVPFANERADGIDTLEWLTAQSFQDGHIALYGMSYLAAVQWVLTDALPPQVKTIVPMVYGVDPYAVGYSGGMFRLEVLTAWAALMPDDSMHFFNAGAYSRAVRHRPHIESDERFFGERLPWYREWITHPNRHDPFWQRDDLQAFRRNPENIDVPVLMIGGWYDLFLPIQLEDFRRLKSRARSRLVIGPWHHLQRADRAVPNDFGLGGQWRQVINWLDHHLRNGPLEGPTGAVQWYAYGRGEWIINDDLTAPSSPHTYYLDGFATAATCEGGRLADTSPASGSASYRYDPDDPVPGRGGSAMLAFAFKTYEAVQPGPVQINGVCRRKDVLTFVSAPLTRPLRLVGAPFADLRVTSNAPDTAFTAKLIEVRADGTAIHVRDGIRSLAYRHGRGDGPPAPYVPGDTIDLRIDLWPIDRTFAVGSRLRIDISSSNFPVYHAHPNRYGLWSTQEEAQIATNTVLHGSRLTLPIHVEQR